MTLNLGFLMEVTLNTTRQAAPSVWFQWKTGLYAGSRLNRGLIHAVAEMTRKGQNNLWYVHTCSHIKALVEKLGRCFLIVPHVTVNITGHVHYYIQTVDHAINLQK